MPQRQFGNRLNPEETNRGVGILDSGVLQLCVAGILNVSQSVISRMWNLIYPTVILTDMAEDATGLQLDVRVNFFVDSVSTSMVS